MPFLLLLLLLGAGCASPGHELQRGTPVRPPPPPVRPGHGAPVMGQPGQQVPALPRSPHRRVLPPTQEPGLWAGDQPQASRKREPDSPVLFGVELPGLSKSAAEVDVGPALGCVALWNAALPGTGLAEQVNALRPKTKRCMVAHMFNHCVRVIEQWEENSRAQGVIILLAWQKRAELRQAANAFFLAECEGVRLTQAQERLRSSLTTRLQESIHE